MKASSVGTTDTFKSKKVAGESKARPDEILDLRGTMCPMNLVKVKLALEQMEDGRNLRVLIDTGEPMRSIPRATKEEGHKIISAEKIGDDSFGLVIRKGGGG
jgi:tRNA 2-thiouridine synthesizing protein A